MNVQLDKIWIYIQTQQLFKWGPTKYALGIESSFKN